MFLNIYFWLFFFFFWYDLIKSVFLTNTDNFYFYLSYIRFLTCNLMFLKIMGNAIFLFYSDLYVKEWLCSNFSCPTFNFPEPETTAKGNSRALKMMKLISLVVILSFLGVFAQDRKIPDDLMRTYPCYPGCITEFEECIKYFKCSLQRRSCFGYCIDEYQNCLKCKV